MTGSENDITSAIKKLHSISFNPIITGLNSSEYFLLKVLLKSCEVSDNNCVKVSDLAKKMRVSAPSVTKILNSLEKKELILRQSDKENRRNTLVFITDKGIEIKKKNDANLSLVMKDVYDRVGRENIIQFLHLAELIQDAFDDEIKAFSSMCKKT